MSVIFPGGFNRMTQNDCFLVPWMIVGLAMAMLGSAEAIEGNPALPRLEESITFYASFDQSTTDAELANGAPTGHPGEPNAASPEFSNGVFLKGLETPNGGTYWGSEGNIDLTKSGGIAFWVSPRGWADRELQYIFLLRLLTPNGQLMVGRMDLRPQGKSTPSIYVYAAVESDSVSEPIHGTGQWEDGEWHLVAVNWTDSEVQLSVDGAPFVKTPFKGFLKNGAGAGRLMLGCGWTDGQEGLFAADEVMAVDRPFSDEEIAKLKAEGMAQTERAGKP